ncbi:RHS repeat-associated core domain-containing protein [uncultured Desulfuromonas sp.]|uniref:RHS repeat domain-containing protein n=1 Tax=uncultured Desulfuromonas sp. TaxID=181013 RepID=UPI002AABADEF|nr:RHS repeat-associated core domain-containing protein [uncultured Desulfuromonas sp.]
MGEFRGQYTELATLTDAKNQTTTYSYNNADWLTNLTTSGLISYNANNELIGHTTVQYQHDANGNTTQKTANGQTTTYDYNSRNRLSRVHLPDGRLVSYRYDPFGRRISKTVAGVTTCYAYSDEGLAAEYDANGTWQKSYGWKPDGLWGTDPVYQRTPTGLYYYHNDHLGTPQRLSDESGDIAWSAGHTAFGNATVDPILSSIDNNLRFPGQYFDQETGLHYNYQRFYDPGTGRYTQVDPIGFFAGDVNLYRYAQSNTINWTDSLGLEIDWDKFFKYTDTIEKYTTQMEKSLEKIEKMIVENVLKRMGVPIPKGLNIVGRLGSGIMGAIVFVLTPTELDDPYLGEDGKWYNPDGSLFIINDLPINTNEFPIKEGNYCEE